jgi:hypothetical protein
MAEYDSSLQIADELRSRLRGCQEESVHIGLSYCATPAASPMRSCLLSLPTGAGKSGVIAILAHQAPQSRVLILSHRRAVCEQLKKEVKGDFFKKIGLETYPIKKNVKDDLSAALMDGVYVNTFQKLARMTSEELSVIKNFFNLIIIDEGHSEPSPIWRTLVRGSHAHKIVITATPYRNDLFQFDIDSSSSYIYTFSQAANDEIIRSPIFQEVKREILLEEITAFLQKNNGAKCIIKCKEFSDVEYYYSLVKDSFNALAIHDRYVKNSDPSRKVSVPIGLNESGYRVLIHQRKLDEGVDVPSAKLLILTYVLGSGRELVQTVGRVVRLFGELRPLVLEIESTANSTMWSNYRLFDDSLTQAHGVDKFLASLDTARLIRSYLDAFPEYAYHDNRFVQKFDLLNFDPERTIVVPTASICFLYVQEGFFRQQAIDTIYWRAESQGELVKTFNADNSGIAVVIFIAFNRSRFLADGFFFEPSLEIFLLKEIGDGIVAIFDSRGRTFNHDDELRIGGPIEPEKLLKVMTLGAKIRPKVASTRSINSARRRPEAITIKGKDLEQIGGQQANAAYRMANIHCDTVDAAGNKSGSYYVSVDFGRVADKMESHFSLSDLSEWFDLIHERLESDAQLESRLIDSFAKPTAVKTSLILESLVFDFSQFDSPLKMACDDVEFFVDNDFQFYSYDQGFHLVENQDVSFVSVLVNAIEPHITFKTHHPIYVIDNESNSEILEDFLTKNLHKVLFSSGVTLSGGKFYQMRLPTEVGFDLKRTELADVLIPIPALQRKGLTEKGEVDEVIQVGADQFSVDSVFNLLDALKSVSDPEATISSAGPFHRYFPDPDLILCSDMGIEPADFIISSESRLVFVHVKCGTSESRPRSSAGALAQVGSQAIKNLEMLISTNLDLQAANWQTLLNAWPSVNAPQKLESRLRLLNGARVDMALNQEQEMGKAWNIIAERRQSFRVKKETWIVTANSFSVSNFERSMGAGAEGNAESLQAYQLIQSWLSSSNSLDCELKIFGSP